MIAYLLASLPTPRLGETPATSPDAFLAACRGFVTPARLRDLAAAVGVAPEPAADDARPTLSAPADAACDDPRGPHPAARAWTDVVAQVDAAVVRQRAARARRDPTPHLRPTEGFRVDVVEAVAAAFERADPGARERALDELRWRLADELAAAAPAGFGALLARAAQLRLAWRWAGWDAEAGWGVLEAALRQIEARHEAAGHGEASRG